MQHASFLSPTDKVVEVVCMQLARLLCLAILCQLLAVMFYDASAPRPPILEEQNVDTAHQATGSCAWSSNYCRVIAFAALDLAITFNCASPSALG